MGIFRGVKTIIRISILALITVVALIIYVKFDYDKALETPNSDSSEKVVLEIAEGKSSEEILTLLVDNGLLKEKWLNYVKAYLKLEDLSSKLQAGTYTLPKNLTIKEIINTLQNGRDPDVWITIPEGLRKDEIADKVVSELPTLAKCKFLELTTDETFIETLGLHLEVTDLEGFLFPDKYAFAPEATEEDVITQMVENFKQKITGDYTYNDVVLASLIEREGYNSTDRAMISDILQRRLDEGWLLQVDASLLYPKNDWNYEITAEDKKLDDPYNTYKKIGLPPTPICNPGLESLSAVKNPIPNNYYFYIHDNDGNAHYAENLAEHEANVNEYLR
jgi:UPF0755 protein